MSLTAYSEGSFGLRSKAVLDRDINDVRFGTFVAGSAYRLPKQARSTSTIQRSAADASRFASATDLSQVSIGGTIAVADHLAFEVAFISSTYNSVVSVYPLAITGGKALLGASYQCLDLIIKTNTSLPGGNIPYSGNADCKVSGLPSDRMTIYSELNAIRTELTDKLSQFDNRLQASRNDLHTELSANHTELSINQSQLADRVQATRNELRRNSIIAICTVLVIANIAGAIAWRQHRRQKQLERMLLKGVGENPRVSRGNDGAGLMPRKSTYLFVVGLVAVSPSGMHAFGPHSIIAGVATLG